MKGSHLKARLETKALNGVTWHPTNPHQPNLDLRHILSHEHVVEHVTSAILVNLRNLATAYHTACNPPHLQNWFHT